MDGFKDSTKVKYTTGGTYNEKGKRATLAEMEAEDRRMGSSMPAKKAVGPSSVAVSKVLAGMAKKAGTRGMGAMTEGEMQMAKKGVPSYSGKPVIRRKTGGLAAMPGKKC
jgi:hypothetical protein